MWPADTWSTNDPDRADDALLRCLMDVHRAEPPDALTPSELRVVGALSQGLGETDVAEVLGITYHSVKQASKLARRKLRAKNTTHMCCEAVRRGLIS